MMKPYKPWVLLLIALIFGATIPVSAETKVVTSDELWKLFDKKMYPVYPYQARRAHAQGSGLYRM